MPTLNDLPITQAQPTDRPHILIWDVCSKDSLQELSYIYGTHRSDYIAGLIARHTQKSKSSFLLLNKRIDYEIQAIRNACKEGPESYVQLEGLDRLITYLAASSRGSLDTFWQQLIDLRQLPKLLWIILPSSLVPDNWPKDRTHYVTNTH